MEFRLFKLNEHESFFRSDYKRRLYVIYLCSVLYSKRDSAFAIFTSFNHNDFDMSAIRSRV